MREVVRWPRNTGEMLALLTLVACTLLQLEALVTHAARRNGGDGQGKQEMIDYEGFLQSFEVVDVEADVQGKANAQAELTSTTSRQRAQSNVAAGLLRASTATSRAS